MQMMININQIEFQRIEIFSLNLPVLPRCHEGITERILDI